MSFSKLSVIVICKNEEENIKRCINSVLHELHDIRIDSEVIVVDSKSTDLTIEMISDLPINIWKITNEDYISPSAGRYVGSKKSSGDALLFIDGDMILETGWVNNALQILEQKGLAGITGTLNKSKRKDIRRVKHISGVMLFDKSEFEEVGGFDPYVRGAEDFELSYRIRTNGSYLIELPTQVAIHPEKNILYEPVRRASEGYYYGSGQILRKHIGLNRRFFEHLYHLKMTWIVAILGVFYPILLFTHKKIASLFQIPVLVIFLIIGYNKGYIKCLIYPFKEAIKFRYILNGIIIGTSNPEGYPIEDVVTIVKSDKKE